MRFTKGKEWATSIYRSAALRAWKENNDARFDKNAENELMERELAQEQFKKEFPKRCEKYYRHNPKRHRSSEV